MVLAAHSRNVIRGVCKRTFRLARAKLDVDAAGSRSQLQMELVKGSKRMHLVI